MPTQKPIKVGVRMTEATKAFWLALAQELGYINTMGSPDLLGKGSFAGLFEAVAVGDVSAKALAQAVTKVRREMAAEGLKVE